MAAERTPLYNRHRALGGRMVAFAGWELPQQYASIREEHLAVRTAAGLFDLSHMGRLEVTGERAAEYLQQLVTNDVNRLGAGQALYTLMCNDEGGILDDLVVYRQEAAFTVVVNASNRQADLDWMRAHAPDGVQVEDRTRDISLLALQGPRAEEIIPAQVAQIAYFGFADGDLGGIPAMISRTGYTGEDGFEIFVASDAAEAAWDRLLKAGEAKGIRPCGLGARDACRLEAGLRLYGNDMDSSTTPYEAGLGWTVKLNKTGEFIGKQALAAAKERGPQRRLVGLKCQDRVIPRHGTAVLVEGHPAGRVTSGTYSFWLNQGIAMAFLPPDLANEGRRVEFEIRGQRGGAEVTRLPFYRGSVKMPASSKA